MSRQSDWAVKDKRDDFFRFNVQPDFLCAGRNLNRLLWIVVMLTLPVWLAGCGGGARLGAQGASTTSSPGTTTTSGGQGTGGSGGTSSTSGGSGGSGTSSTSGGSGGGGAVSSGTVISNLQTAEYQWSSYGQVEPDYVNCSPSPCDGVSWSMQTGVTLPSLSNNATQFNLGGTTPYGDAFFETGVIGQNSEQIPDNDHTLLPTLHHFTYNADFYVTNPDITQALEFGIALWMSKIAGMSFSTHCDHLNDGTWKLWNNATKHWVSTGKPCSFVKGWNHVTLQFKRSSDNSTLYQSITLNGKTYTLNQSYPGIASPTGWWGLDTSYQMDGDYKQSPNTTYLDNVSVTYE